MVGRFSVPLRHGSHDRGVTLEPCVVDGQETDASLTYGRRARVQRRNGS